MPTLTLRCLGPLEIRLGTEPLTGFETQKARALLVYLACHAGQAFAREHLRTLLWSESTPDRASRSLRQAMINLRRVVPGNCLLISRQTVAFNARSDYDLDVAQFEKDPPEVRLYRGNFLEGFDLRDAPRWEEWLVARREELQVRTLAALEALGAHLAARREHAAAIEHFQRALSIDPWRETAHQALMRLHALAGDRAAALAQYEKCRAALAEGLGVEPSETTDTLYRRVRSGAAARPAGMEAHAEPTPFLGREKELAELAGLLAHPHCRLVTIAGLGGVGKTRLALRAAADHAWSFVHGVFFVRLAAIDSTSHVIPAIADSLGLPLSPREDPRAQLLDYLREKELLLVLDNLEHLLPADCAQVGEGQPEDAAELVAAILRSAPKVKVVATSRERLRLRWEWLFELQGLPCPPGEEANGAEGFGAVQLLVATARRVERGFTLDEGNRRWAVRICRMMEGLPLGIELAAGQLRHLTCEAIARRIETGLDLLATSLRDVPARHRSLRAAFDTTWSVLSHDERRALRQLSVFRGGFGLDAAEAIAGAPAALLSSLADKSLLRRGSNGHFRLHPLLREYAWEALQADPAEADRVRELHAGYYAEFLHGREPELKDGRQREAAEEIGTEIENLQAAWRWAASRGRAADLAKASESLSIFYDLRGWAREGEEAFRLAAEQLAWRTDAPGIVARGKVLTRRAAMACRLGRYDEAKEYLQVSLGIARRCEDPGEGALCLHTLGYAHYLCGELRDARENLEECLALAREAGDGWATASALNSKGIVACEMGEYGTAGQLHRESLAIRQGLGDRRGMALSYGNLGIVAYEQGEYEEARRFYREALAIRQALEDRRGTALTLNNLANAAFELGDLNEARRLHQECREVFEEIGDRRGLASSLNNLGNVATTLREHAEGRDLFMRSLALKRDIGDRRGAANTLNNLCKVALEMGDHRESRRYNREALATAVEVGTIPLALEALLWAARLLESDGKPEGALELLSHILHHPATQQGVRTMAEARLVEVAAHLPAPVAAQAVERGKARPFDEVVLQTCEVLKTSQV